jgi:PAS domain S-box-containing protein
MHWRFLCRFSGNRVLGRTLAMKRFSAPLLRYGVAASAVGVVFVFKLLLDAAFAQDATPFRLFLAAVVVATFYGGLGPGIFATALVVPIVDYFFLSPLNAFTGLTSQSIPLGLFALEGIVVSALVAALRSARERAQKSTEETWEHRERLRESEERFRSLVEGVKDYAIFMVDPEGRVASWNEGARRIKGYEAEEVLGRHFSLFYPEEEVERGHPEEELRIAAAEGRYEEEGLRVRKDGSMFWASVLITALEDEEGNLRGFSKVTRDVTERRRAEEKLRRSEERFRALVQNASDVITVLEADGTIRYESPSIERVLGYRPGELVGKSAFSYVHPDDRRRVAAAFAEAVQSSESTTVELRFSRKDGSWCHLEAVGRSLLEDPSVRGVVVNSRDVTERKRAEEKLHSAFDSLLALYEAGQILGSTLSSEQVVTSLLRIMRGVSGLAAAVISVADEDGGLRVWHTADLEALWPGARHDPEAVRARELALKTGERRLFWLRGPVSQPGDLTGLCLPLKIRERVVGVLEAYGPERLAHDDATELLSSLAAQSAGALENARLYEELSEREHRLHDLVGKVLTAQEEERRRVAYEVHDGLAQTAAAALQLLHTFARRHPPASEKAQRDLDRVLELVQGTVGEARQVIADLRPTVLDDFGLSAAIRAQIEKLGDRQVDYEVDLGDERLPATLEVGLFRIAQEALTNAAKHAPSAPVRIELRRADGKVQLRVRDWGPGFETEKITNGGGPGERVGLSSMRQRVALLGGKLVVSARPGEGTEVVTEVPLPEGWQEEGGEELDG